MIFSIHRVPAQRKNTAAVSLLSFQSCLPSQPSASRSPFSLLPLKAMITVDFHLPCLFVLLLLQITLKVKHWQPFAEWSPSILGWFCQWGQIYSSSVSPVSSYLCITKLGLLFTHSFHLLTDARSIHLF